MFDSESEATLTPRGGARYQLTYVNRADRELSCVGVVMPEELAGKAYTEMQGPDFEIDAFLNSGMGFSPEVEEAILDARDKGHVAFAEGSGGVSYRDYLRAMAIADNPGASGATIRAIVDKFIDDYGPTLKTFGLTSFDQDVVNFVRRDALARWDVRLPEALPGGQKAGGIVTCFDGLSRQIALSETTYVEIEHAAEGPGVTGGGVGALSSSGLFGS